MTTLTTLILEKIKFAVANQQQYIPASNVELTQAIRYIDDLVSNTTDLDIIEKALIRFFRIRPKQYNAVGTPLSTIHSILMELKLLPDTPETAEEKLLSEFLFKIFTQITQSASMDPEVANIALIYKTVANVEPAIKTLTKHVLSFDLNNAEFLTGNTRLHNAVTANDIPLIMLLLAAGANIHELNRLSVSPLDKALSSQNEDIILRFITQPGITLSESNKSKLHTVFYDAVLHGRDNLVTAILSIDNLDKKTFINTPRISKSSSPNKAEIKTSYLDVAAIIGNKKITKILLDNGADANLIHSHNTALSLVAGRTKEQQKPEHRDIVVLLLAAMTPAAVNIVTQDGGTALGWAFNTHHRAIVKLLVNFEGINLSTLFHDRYNALIPAIDNGWNDIVEIILSKDDGKKLVNSVLSDGSTPLHCAASRGDKAIVELLLENGANANVINTHNNTPLILVAGRNPSKQPPDDPAIAKLLLEVMTPDYVNLKAERNLTAMEWAVSKLNQAIVLLLVQYKGSNLDDLFGELTIDQVAIDYHWTDVTHAIKIRTSVETWLENNEKDTLDNRVRDLSLTVNEKNGEIEKLNMIIDEKNEEIEKLNMIIQELRSASNAEPVRIIFRPSVDTSALRAPGSGASPSSSPKKAKEAFE
jgi:ankyrin repeat protein